MPGSDGASNETPWTRLSTAFKYATSPVEADKEVGCLSVVAAHTLTSLLSSTDAYVQVPDAPPELKEWSHNTSLGVFAGLMFGGGSQWHRDRQAGIQQNSTAQS